ncbi:hypothetical protein PHISCL_04967 [Aspergillus sclerotialis]|uniref:DUF6594 domain-containing protein n=1 Tax=Aspergillus sclerotialis TaxID=2070753 RepID=A0A3A2ZI39_9EURO|nr:hypothetical protein PHISCL_04967 [Aspergillus sclerotialis]
MDPGAVSSGDAIVNVDSHPGTPIDEKQEPSSKGSADEGPSWPKINPDGTTPVPDAELQKKYWRERFSTVFNFPGEKSDREPLKPFSRLANLSIAYYQHDLQRMEETLRKNEGVLNDEQLRSLRKTLNDYYTAFKQAHEVNRIYEDENEEFQGIRDRYAKLVAAIVEVFLMPPLFVLAVARMAFRRLIRKPAMDGEVLGAVLFSLDNSHKLAEKIASVVIAIIASGSLLGPMIALSYIEEMKYRLLTVCLCVVAFSMCLMLILRLSTMDLVGVVAGYTGILIVYLGT